MLVALLILAGVGHLEWAVYASFGVFAAVYGGATSAPGRWRTQSAMALLLTAAVVTGAVVGLSDERRWASIPAAALWAALAAGLSDRFRWRPPGPMFFVFAVAACASVASTVRDVTAALALCGGTAIFAILLGVLEQRLPNLRPVAAASTPPEHAATSSRRRLHLARCAAAVAVAGTMSTATGIGHPYWAMVAAVVPLAAFTLEAQLIRGVHRTSGTTLGVLLAAGLLHLHLPTAVAILTVAVLQGLTELLVSRHYGAALVFVTPLALLLVQLAVDEPVSELVEDRLIETVIGVAVGLVVVLLTRQRVSNPGIPAGRGRRPLSWSPGRRGR
jgi:hypothetical protein